MPPVDVRDPLYVSVDPNDEPTTVTNTGNATVWYQDASKGGTISQSIHDGSITAGSVLSFATSTYFLAAKAGGQVSLTLTPIGVLPGTTVTVGVETAYLDPMKAPYNCKFDGVTDDTAGLQAAINAAAVTNPNSVTPNDQFGRIVKLPPGKAVTTAPLTMPPNVRIEGHGSLSSFIVQSGSVFDAITLAATINGGIQLAHFGIVCNGAGGGINFANQSAGASILGDTRHVFDDLVVVAPGAANYGLTFAGTECRVNNITVQRPAGTGIFVQGTDHMIEQITIGGGTGTGNVLQVSTSNSRIMNVKVFNSLGQSLFSGGRNQYFGIEIQDVTNAGAVMSINSGQTQYVGVVLDSCTCGPGGAISLGGGQNVLRGQIIVDRGGGSYHTNMGMSINAGAEHDVEMIMNVGAGGFTSRSIVGGANCVGSRVRFNNMGGAIAVAYASTITPQPTAGTVYEVGMVTGNLTIANPTSALSPATTTEFWAGMEFVFVLPVDGTGGYTLTFGNTFKLVGAAAPALAANTVVQIAFRYDGTNWRETKRSIT